MKDTLRDVDDLLENLRAIVEGDVDVRRADRLAKLQGVDVGNFDKHAKASEILPVYLQMLRQDPKATIEKMQADHRLKNAGWQMSRRFMEDAQKLADRKNAGADQWYRRYEWKPDYHANPIFTQQKFVMPINYVLYAPTAIRHVDEIYPELQAIVKRHFGPGWTLAKAETKSGPVSDALGWRFALEHPMDGGAIATLMKMES